MKNPVSVSNEISSNNAIALDNVFIRRFDILNFYHNTLIEFISCFIDKGSYVPNRLQYAEASTFTIELIFPEVFIKLMKYAECTEGICQGVDHLRLKYAAVGVIAIVWVIAVVKL